MLTLSFEHERAAVHRLAGFGDQVEVLDPPSVRTALLATAREILGRYEAEPDGEAAGGIRARVTRRDGAASAGGHWPRRR